jgi:hypothetical protein
VKFWAFEDGFLMMDHGFACEDPFCIICTVFVHAVVKQFSKYTTQVMSAHKCSEFITIFIFHDR